MWKRYKTRRILWARKDDVYCEIRNYPKIKPKPYVAVLKVWSGEKSNWQVVSIEKYDILRKAKEMSEKKIVVAALLEVL